MAGVDERLEREAGRGGVLGLCLEAVEVGDVRVDGVDGELAVRRRGEQGGRAGVQRDAPVAAVGVAAGPAAHRGHEVLRAPQQRDDVRRGGDLLGAQDAQRRLHQRDDLPVAVAGDGVKLLAALRLGHHDRGVLGLPDGGDVRVELGRADRVDADDDPARVLGMGEQRLAGGALGRRADAVLQVEDHPVGGGQGLGVPVRPVRRAKQQGWPGQLLLLLSPGWTTPRTPRVPPGRTTPRTPRVPPGRTTPRTPRGPGRRLAHVALLRDESQGAQLASTAE